MEAFPRCLAAGAECPPDRCRGQSSHQARVLGDRSANSSAGTRASNFAVMWPEDDIPDLYRTTSIVVMPYDSATGSSGPAHQACEYGVPIVCADMADFREWRRTKTWPSASTKSATRAISRTNWSQILQSPEQQRQLAHHNFSAAMRMTMPSVVRHYLRWFELSRHRQTMSGFVKFPLLQSRRRLRNAASIRPSWSWTLLPSSVADGESTQNPTEGAPVAGDHDLADTPNSDLTGTE